MTLNKQESLHYSRHLNLAEVGIDGQLRLKNARILYIGAGGLGSAALPYLAAAGVGTIGIIDNDIIEPSNLQRQILYSYNTIGQKKTIVIQKHLEQLNPFINIKLHDTRLSKSNALEILNQYDVIADGSDNFATRYLVNDACFHLKKPNIYASISQFNGQCTVFVPGESPCYRCLFPTPPPLHIAPNCAEGGVLGVLPGVIGTIQATEIIKLLLDTGHSLINRLLQYNALMMTFQEISITLNPECRLCVHQQPFDTIPFYERESCKMNQSVKDEITVQELQALQNTNADFILLDVREPFEYTICNLNGELIPLKLLPENLFTLDKTKHIIVHCKLGGRSAQAVKFLKENGFTHVSNLVGGIIAWIEQIDPTMTKY